MRYVMGSRLTGESIQVGRFSLRLVLRLFSILLVCSPAYAQDSDEDDSDEDLSSYSTYAEDGSRTGTIKEDDTGRYLLYDKNGARTGTVKKDGDRYLVYDKAGKRIGTVKKSY